MNQIQAGNTRQLVHLLTMLGSAGKWLLPEAQQQEQTSTEEYLQVRQVWEEAGLVELDFDGKLHPTKEFARMTYNITKAQGAISWEQGEEKRIFLRGPVDNLQLICVQDRWTMELCPPSAVMTWAKEQLMTADCGILTTLGTVDGVPVLDSLESEDERVTLLLKHLDIYYGGGKSHA